MDLRVVQSSTKEEWNKALLDLPNPHLLQTWEWGSFKSRHGWRATRCLFVERGTDKPRAAASLLTRRLRPVPLSVMYVPKGPVVDYSNNDLLNSVLHCLETAAGQAHSLFVKIDPDLTRDTKLGEDVLGSLRLRGWRRSDREIQFRNTLLLDLTPSLDELLMGMKSKWRYNIRLARRKGVTVRPATGGDLPLLYDMYEETARRGGFVIRPQSYYGDAWGSFTQAGLAQPFIAEWRGEPLAMVIVYRFAEQAYYMYGASYSHHRETMPNHLLQWEAIQWAKEQSCKTYDLWGAPDELDSADPMWGVYRFKKGFGGEFVEHIGAWDYPSSRPLYWMYSVAIPWMMATMRWLHWRRSEEG